MVDYGTALVGVVAVLGWGLALLMIGLWLGERKTRRMMHDLGVFGTAHPLKRAEVWAPQMEAEGEEHAAGPRLERPEEQPNWSEDTITAGVLEVLAVARDQNVPMSEQEAREEVLLMLNSPTGEIE